MAQIIFKIDYETSRNHSQFQQWDADFNKLLGMSMDYVYKDGLSQEDAQKRAGMSIKNHGGMMIVKEMAGQRMTEEILGDGTITLVTI